MNNFNISMDEYFATIRTNYFRVSDAEAFEEWIGQFDLRVWSRNDTYAFGKMGSLGFPHYDPVQGEYIEFFEELAKHLRDGEIAVLLESGGERLRHVNGLAWAINSAGKIVKVSLVDIYEKAAEAFGVPDESISRADI